MLLRFVAAGFGDGQKMQMNGDYSEQMNRTDYLRAQKSVLVEDVNQQEGSLCVV